MSFVYVVRYSLCCGTELVSCYESMDGAISRLKMMQASDSFTDDESITITKEEIITDEEASLRLKRIRKHYT